MRAAILTVSDSTARGERGDESGPHIGARLRDGGWHVVAAAVVPDDAEAIVAFLVRASDELGVDVVLTTGGTGFSPRDLTPEATARVLDRLAPGIPEALRATGMQKTQRACLSRGIAGLRGATLIVNLPGSLKAVREGMDFLLQILPHAVEMKAGGGH